mmetsp:Transcript_79448/g.157941  ORF Transcript_79448/g.157941 Transcript_79448/m.157941 type:complete len:201 (-) Transcript_79448:2122-2724(-)
MPPVIFPAHAAEYGCIGTALALCPYCLLSPHLKSECPTPPKRPNLTLHPTPNTQCPTFAQPCFSTALTAPKSCKPRLPSRRRCLRVRTDHCGETAIGGGKQLGRRALLDQPAVIKHADAVKATDVVQPVRIDQKRAVKCEQHIHHTAVTAEIDIGSRLVTQEHAQLALAAVSHERTGEGHQLSLTLAQVGSLNGCVQAVG